MAVIYRENEMIITHFLQEIIEILNWGFATNANFLILIYYILRLFDNSLFKFAVVSL